MIKRTPAGPRTAPAARAAAPRWPAPRRRWRCADAPPRQPAGQPAGEGERGAGAAGHSELAATGSSSSGPAALLPWHLTHGGAQPCSCTHKPSAQPTWDCAAAMSCSSASLAARYWPSSLCTCSVAALINERYACIAAAAGPAPPGARKSAPCSSNADVAYPQLPAPPAPLRCGSPLPAPPAARAQSRASPAGRIIGSAVWCAVGSGCMQRAQQHTGCCPANRPSTPPAPHTAC